LKRPEQTGRRGVDSSVACGGDMGWEMCWPRPLTRGKPKEKCPTTASPPALTSH